MIPSPDSSARVCLIKAKMAKYGHITPKAVSLIIALIGEPLVCGAGYHALGTHDIVTPRVTRLE
jgi:hypothetical protein